MPSSPLRVATRRIRRSVGHHMRPASRGSQRSASRVTLTSCSTTDSGLLLDLLDHRPGVRAERRRQDHLHLGLVLAEDDLLDQRELDDVHPDLGVDDGPQRVEDRELGGAPLGIERGRSGAHRRRRPRRLTGDLWWYRSLEAPGAYAPIRTTGLAVRPDQAAEPALTTTPGRRYWTGRSAASASVYPGPASEPSGSKNSA